MAPHTQFPKGKRVLVILRDGSQFVAKFDHKSTDDREIAFLDHETIRISKIRAMGYYKPQGGTTS